MKKSLLALGLTLSIVLAMATPAFAANTATNVNLDGTAVTAPGSPDYDGATKTQAAGQSFNEASITNKVGTDGTTPANWEVVNDDDAVARATDTTGDINVWAKVVDKGSKIYKVDLAWGAMKFEYKAAGGQWNPETHAYADGGTGATGWTEATFIDSKNNKVTVTNHSNNAIDAAFAYKMEGVAFNATPTGNDAVLGNFFADNTAAIAAAKVLKGTYATGTVADAAVTGKLTGSKVALATADAYNSSVDTPTTAADDKVAGARSKDVFFAFSGTPDAGKGKDLNTFQKVGVITVTVTPNNEVPLNRPPYTVAP